MTLDHALQLRKGCKVQCPEDRGYPAHTATVIDGFTDKKVYTNMHGTKYIWVLVQGVSHKSTWPSNRLGRLT